MTSKTNESLLNCVILRHDTKDTHGTKVYLFDGDGRPFRAKQQGAYVLQHGRIVDEGTIVLWTPWDNSIFVGIVYSTAAGHSDSAVNMGEGLYKRLPAGITFTARANYSDILAEINKVITEKPQWLEMLQPKTLDAPKPKKRLDSLQPKRL